MPKKKPRKRAKRPQYKARHGARFSDRDARVIGPVLTKLARAGRNKAADVVREARGRSSPLHRYFEWDDTKAAHQYRLDQARYMIRHVEVTIEKADPAATTRAYHFVSIERDGEAEDRFATVAMIRADKNLSMQVVRKAMKEAIAWKQRYRQYAAVFDTVFEAIDELGSLDADAA